MDVDLSLRLGSPTMEELRDMSTHWDGRTKVTGDDDTRWALMAKEIAIVV